MWRTDLDSADGKQLTPTDDATSINQREVDENLLTNKEHFFPQLVWKQVLNKLKDKAAIENCSNASQFFGDLLLEKRKREVVLPKVFGILAKRYCDEKNKDQSYRETNIKSVTWKISSGRGKPHRMTGIWKSRLVCKEWNQAIEETHRNESAGHYSMGGYIGIEGNFELGQNWGSSCFNNESVVKKFLEHFGLTPYDSSRTNLRKCPFLGRSVTINYEPSRVENVQAYFDRIMKMLSKFGVGVWYFSIFSRGLDLVQFYQQLRVLIELMPNLKVLQIHYISTLGNCISYREVGPRLLALENAIKTNPFPKLKHLELFGSRHYPTLFSKYLISENRQISRLQILKSRFCIENDTTFVYNLPNITHLYLKIERFEQFEKFEIASLSLKLVNFYFIYPTNLPFVPWSCVFNAIESNLKSDSCTDLKLEMPHPTTDVEKSLVFEESLSYRLNFHIIQRIDVCCHADHCLDFLIPSKKSLRQIKVQSDMFFRNLDVENLADKQVIKFLDYKNRMQDSNIKKMFPFLKELKVHGRGCFTYNFESDKVKMHEEYEYDWDDFS